MRNVDEKQRFHLTDVEGAAGGTGAPLVGASHALAAGVDPRAVARTEFLKAPP
jgi:hypothetical protein